MNIYLIHMDFFRLFLKLVAVFNMIFTRGLFPTFEDYSGPALGTYNHAIHAIVTDSQLNLTDELR
jgi:hypothetical protein